MFGYPYSAGRGTQPSGPYPSPYSYPAPQTTNIYGQRVVPPNPYANPYASPSAVPTAIQPGQGAQVPQAAQQAKPAQPYPYGAAPAGSFYGQPAPAPQQAQPAQPIAPATGPLPTEPIPLFAPSERTAFENMKAYYALLRTLNALEEQFIRSNVSKDVYMGKVREFLKKIDSLKSVVRVPPEDFCRMYGVQDDFRLAIERCKNGPPVENEPQAALLVANTVSAFIGISDLLAMEKFDCESLASPVSSVVHYLQSNPKIPAGWPDLAKLAKWNEKFSGMMVSDEITEDEARQLQHDVAQAHEKFMQRLGQ